MRDTIELIEMSKLVPLLAVCFLLMKIQMK